MSFGGSRVAFRGQVGENRHMKQWGAIAGLFEGLSVCQLCQRLEFGH